MEPWEEQIVRLRTERDIATKQEKVDSAIVEHLIAALYFSQSAAKELGGLIKRMEESGSRKNMECAHNHVLQAMLAVLRTAEVAGIGAQIEFAEAMKLLRADAGVDASRN